MLLAEYGALKLSRSNVRWLGDRRALLGPAVLEMERLWFASVIEEGKASLWNIPSPRARFLYG